MHMAAHTAGPRNVCEGTQMGVEHTLYISIFIKEGCTLFFQLYTKEHNRKKRVPKVLFFSKEHTLKEHKILFLLFRFQEKSTKERAQK